MKSEAGNEMNAPGATPAVALVLEDSEALRQSTCALVEDTGLFTEVVSAGDGLEGLQMLVRRPVDIVLCDMHMPRCDGLKFLSMRAQVESVAHIPVIMLTGDKDTKHMVRALEAGACDYVTKPAEETELRARLDVHLKLKQASDELRRKTAELQQLSRTDALTGIANRRQLEETLELEFHRTERYGRPLSLIMLDLDYFKRLNDEHGHIAGDHVLQQVAKLLSAGVRRNDLAARYGGEEFSVVLPETPLHSAAAVAERLRISLCQTRMLWDGEPLSVSGSFGVAALPAQGVTSANELLALADKTLYRAKRQGRNRVAVLDATSIPEPQPQRGTASPPSDPDGS